MDDQPCDLLQQEPKLPLCRMEREGPADRNNRRRRGEMARRRPTLTVASRFADGGQIIGGLTQPKPT
jgi:hypothetical protein